jgi:hypothetical protein
MREVPVNVANVEGDFPVFQQEKAKGFEEYFGVNPQLVEGAAFFGNSDRQAMFRNITMGEDDLTGD